MTNLILFDDTNTRQQLFPLTFTRPIGELRIGILKIREKWEYHLHGNVSYITQDYLSAKYPIHIEEDNLIINASVLPTPNLCTAIRKLKLDEAILQNGELIAARLDEVQFDKLMRDEEIEELEGFEVADLSLTKIKNPWDIFLLNAEAIKSDFDLLTHNRVSQPLSTSNYIKNPANVFVEPGAVVECSILNASNGPIYIGRDAEVMENCTIRGAFALCASSTLKMGAKIYGATTVGPHSKVGGEVNNSVITGYSNKGHDGFLGNSVIGEWCNLGADTNNSNLKNNYSEVKLWNYVSESFQLTGQQFCGLIMGDHSKCGINTMFNTGTVVGVCANVFGDGYPRNFIPSFAWGGAKGFKTYRKEDAMDTMERVMQRRKKSLKESDRKIIDTIFADTAKFRRWEKNGKK